LLFNQEASCGSGTTEYKDKLGVPDHQWDGRRGHGPAQMNAKDLIPLRYGVVLDKIATGWGNSLAGKEKVCKCGTGS